ncbi:unannotated protein [freshwater metagenome]|uniref:Unannotated protein n=1 Tax=freshwater metagenome TaxID=449393 RepID=A0A6J7XTT8_9ZZZZ|nr:DUF4236 domain-containing protein [Actinomycetota bacterium]
MSLRFRRSMKIAPGIRLNFNKNSIGISAGVPGARISLNSKGDIYRSVGIPGTGLSSVTRTSTRGTARQRAARAEQEAQAPTASKVTPSPGLFAGKAERAFYAFLLEIYNPEGHQESGKEIVELADKVIALHPGLELPLKAVQTLHTVGSDETISIAVSLADYLWSKRIELFAHPLAKKYFTGLTVKIQITPGISTNDILNLDTFGFIYVEVLQQVMRTSEALAVLEEMNADQLTAISLADVELELKDYDSVLETTDDIENEDDATALLLIQRGIAFREKGLNDAARESFKKAIAKKDRSEAIINRGLFERHFTYINDHKKSLAIKDLEKILSNESDYPGAMDAINALEKEA